VVVEVMPKTKQKIYLSPPHMSGLEQSFVRDAFETNWIAPLGPHVDAFEREFCESTGAAHAAARTAVRRRGRAVETSGSAGSADGKQNRGRGAVP